MARVEERKTQKIWRGDETIKLKQEAPKQQTNREQQAPSPSSMLMLRPLHRASDKQYGIIFSIITTKHKRKHLRTRACTLLRHYDAFMQDEWKQRRRGGGGGGGRGEGAGGAAEEEV